MPNHIKALAESFGIADLAAPLQRLGLSESEIDDTARLLSLAWSGNDRARVAVNEALTTSDLFRSAAGDVLDLETEPLRRPIGRRIHRPGARVPGAEQVVVVAQREGREARAHERLGGLRPHLAGERRPAALDQGAARRHSAARARDHSRHLSSFV